MPTERKHSHEEGAKSELRDQQKLRRKTTDRHKKEISGQNQLATCRNESNSANNRKRQIDARQEITAREIRTGLMRKKGSQPARRPSQTTGQGDQEVQCASPVEQRGIQLKYPNWLTALRRFCWNILAQFCNYCQSVHSSSNTSNIGLCPDMN